MKPPNEPARDELTALRRHTAFFDRNHDGFVTIDDVVAMLRLLGCSDPYARINAVGGMLARATSDPLLSHDVIVEHAHHGKFRCPHLTGETRIFDRCGRFDEARFEEVLACYAHSGVDGLTESDIAAMIADISAPGSVARSSSELAFRLLMTIAGEPGPDGQLMLTRNRLRAFYKGDLLPALRGGRNESANPEPVARTVVDVLVGATRVFRAALVPGRVKTQRT